MKKLIALGKNADGETWEFDCSDGNLYCPANQFTELIIPEGVKYVECSYNQITELKIPKGVKTVYCWDNQLTELIIPEGVETVSCENNQISHLDLPESVIRLWCDKKVAGLENHIGKVKMKLI